VLIGSFSKKTLDFSRNVFASIEYDDINIDNAFFIESGIRYSLPFYKDRCDTYAYSVSKH